MLSFHLGFGSIMAPGPYPIQRAGLELGLETLGPPSPPVDLTPDQWLKTGQTGILLTQRMATWPEPSGLVRDLWSAAYAAYCRLTAGRSRACRRALAGLPPGARGLAAERSAWLVLKVD